MQDTNDHLHTVVNEDGGAILDIEQGRISTLNPIGAHVWQKLVKGETLETIISDLAEKTGEKVDVIERDVRDFVEDLKINHLLDRMWGVQG